jgi:DNA-binding protein HU-beta
MTLFWKYLPDLFKQGRIYMLEAPEYMSKYKDKIYFGPTVKSIYKQTGTEKCEVRHIKGWGELDAEDMQPIAFDVKARRMFRILPPRNKEGIVQFQALMGKKATYRQQLLGVIGNDEGDDEKPKKAAAKKTTKKAEEKAPAKKSKSVRIDHSGNDDDEKPKRKTAAKKPAAKAAAKKTTAKKGKK